jgi:hypothetical protein
MGNTIVQLRGRLNGDSFMPPGGLCHPSDDFGSKF